VTAIQTQVIVLQTAAEMKIDHSYWCLTTLERPDIPKFV